MDVWFKMALGDMGRPKFGGRMRGGVVKRDCRRSTRTELTGASPSATDDD